MIIVKLKVENIIEYVKHLGRKPACINKHDTL